MPASNPRIEPRPAVAPRERPARPRTLARSWPVLTVFACIVALQLGVAVTSIDVMSAVRAYVTGESLYSKGQKDAHIRLIDYAEYHREEDYQAFLRALAFPIGDRAAREAMQSPSPQVDAARRGLIAGGTDAGDVPGVIRLFNWFHKTPLMADAIATWTDGDRVIEQIRVTAERAHDLVVAGNLDAPEVTDLRRQAQRLNEELTPLEVRFAAQLGDGARLSQRLLLGLNLSLAVLLGLSGLIFVRRSARAQAAAETELRLRRESLQRLLDSAAEGLYGMDTLGRCTFINRSALKMLGYARESELLGREMSGLIHPTRSDARAGTDVPTGAEAGEVHVVDALFRRRDGTFFPVEYWIHPMLKDGRLDGAVATFFDISERVNMQAALRQGEVRIAGLVDAVNDGVMTIDSDQRVVQFNRAAERLFAVPAADAIGSDVERFFPRPSTAQGGATSAVSRFGGNSEAGEVLELFGKRADGHEFPVEASLSRLTTERGTMVTAVIRDVAGLQTARAERQAREALEASSRAKTEFLSRMSHELRTPLNAVLGFSQLLRLDASERPTLQQLERIQHIENAGAHLLALVNDVLDLSRVESGQMTATLEPVDLRSAVEDAISMVLPLAQMGGIAISVDGLEGDLVSQDPGDEEIFVVADRVRLRQVLVNLLSNAVKYNRPQGEVRVQWQVSSDRCELRITDDGYGMAPEKLAQLFEPFNRLGAENSKIEGTGIGLVLSRRLVELMRGELRIESGVDRGTMASVMLARSAEEPVGVGGPSPPSQHGDLDETMRVLYAEDNEVNVEIVRQVVKLRPSVAFDVAENGAIAFHKARRDQPHLMLVDMNLGDMTGIELAHALQSDPSTAGIRLVALSADALPEQIENALANGFEDYLTKPIDFRDLLDVLDGRRGA
ncbi:MAG: PAS domain S-box protein [Caldimonas sp.]